MALTTYIDNGDLLVLATAILFAAEDDRTDDALERAAKDAQRVMDRVQFGPTPPTKAHADE